MLEILKDIVMGLAFHITMDYLLKIIYPETYTGKYLFIITVVFVAVFAECFGLVRMSPRNKTGKKAGNTVVKPEAKDGKTEKKAEK